MCVCVVETDEDLHGCREISVDGEPMPEMLRVFGDQSGPLGIISTGLDIFLLAPGKGEGPGRTFARKPDLHDISHIAVAGNGRVCIVKDQNHVFSYREFAAFTTAEQHERTWHIATKNIVQLVANESSFSLLTAEGAIYSWGDPRYSLGREVLADSPATDPALVTALEGLRISKISAGGWLTAALSNDRDLYIWGRTSSGGDIASDVEFLPDEPGSVGLVDLGEGVDISDIAVGSGHVCLLTDGGDVYAAGRNSNGQVGAGEGEFQSKWIKWEIAWEGTAKEVYSGPFSWNTFVVVETEQAEIAST